VTTDAADGLVLSDLHRRFGDVAALSGLSFAVEPGSLHGFVGANGAGKTTAMRIVVGVDRPDSGTVTLDGAPIDARGRRRVGYLPEERGLYPDMRAHDQLVHLGRLHGMLAADAADAATRLLDRLGLAERADDPVGELSQGNQQRVQLAAALLHDPDLLLLDEPFSGLDPVAAEVMAELLVEHAERGVPVLFSSHQLELVERLCDHVTIIAEGRLVADGRIAELRRARARRRLRVLVDGPAPDLSGVAGVEAVERGTEGALLVTLAPDADDQLLLDAARAAGPVRAFAPVEPTLAELYRDAVTESDAESDAEEVPA